MVLELPPRLSLRSQVRMESRYGMYAGRLLPLTLPMEGLSTWLLSPSLVKVFILWQLLNICEFCAEGEMQKCSGNGLSSSVTANFLKYYSLWSPTDVLFRFYCKDITHVWLSAILLSLPSNIKNRCAYLKWRWQFQV